VSDAVATGLRRPLPMLDTASATADRDPRQAPAPERRLAEFVTEDVMLPRFHVWTLGCQMNHSDSEEIAGALLAAGCSEAAAMDVADLIVINSCAIREAAEQKVIGRMGTLARLKASNPALRVVLTGCSVRADNTSTLQRRYPAVDLFLRPDEEPELAARLGLAGATAAGALASTAPMPASVAGLGLPEIRRVGRSVAAVADRLPAARSGAVADGRVARGGSMHAWLPIIYGCDKTCTYCIVPFSRGPERSRPFDDVIAEARSLASAGFQEVTLLGQNVNSYGHDLSPEPRFAGVLGERTLGRRLALDGKPDIAALLRAIDALRTSDGRQAIPRLRFVTSHPWDLTDRLIKAMAECPSVCEHLHLPVQSGSDAVLHRMGRQYTVAAYLELVQRLRAAIPAISLTTDVIVGFCGETEPQFEATLDLLRTVRFDQVFAAAFSARPGTPATRLHDDVPRADKRRRLNALLELQETIGLERNMHWLGRTTEVLVEEQRPAPSPGHGHDGAAGPRLAGRNREHRLVHFDGSPELIGRRVPVTVERAGPYALSGRLAG
jgi:tRNA-2-methylthio-N6-dimethylallyladenosine synthase